MSSMVMAALRRQAPLGGCSGAWASPPGALTDLQHAFLPAVINLLLRSVWHQTTPHLGEAVSCNEVLSDHLLPYICFWLCHWSAVCVQATCFDLLSYGFLFWHMTEASFGDKRA